MKKHHLFLSVLIILFPFLLGNAPSPYPYAKAYDDYTLTPFVREELPDNTFSYSATVTNTGAGFISVNDTYVRVSDTVWLESDPLDYSIILPNTSAALIYTHETSLDTTTFELYIRAYEELEDEYTLSNFTNITRQAQENGTYIYAYEMDITVNTSRTYEIVTVYEYSGETFASSNRHYLHHPCFFSKTLMEPENITITNAYLLQGRARSNSGMYFYIFILIAIIATIIVGVFVLVGIPLIITLFFIQRNKLKKQNETSAENTNKDNT